MNGQALGQPADPADAARMLRLLSARVHSVISAVCVIAPDGRRARGAGVSRVSVAPLSAATIRAYVASGEPMDKAGAYAIQGAFGRHCRLERGQMDTVIGLPLHVLWRLLRRAAEVSEPASARLART